MNHGEREPRSQGGHARAKKLTAKQRSEMAKKAAEARWNDDVPEAICGSPDTPLIIGDVEIPCYVLDTGDRVLTQAGVLTALGRHRRAAGRSPSADGNSTRLPPILQGKAIEPFVTDDMVKKSHPITFRTPYGSRASGYRADLLPDICEVYLKARDAEKLPQNQAHVARQAEVLMRGLASVGIIALVDEATGYQEIRAARSLARILEEFIAEELQQWVSTFPPDFYAEMFRLRGLDYPQATVKRPQYFGHLTNDVVYKRLAPGVLDELKREIPRNDKGQPKAKYFQKLTSNVGYPKLREHLGSVVTLMKLSDDWDSFKANLDRIHPKYGTTPPLPLTYDDEADTGRGM